MGMSKIHECRLPNSRLKNTTPPELELLMEGLEILSLTTTEYPFFTPPRIGRSHGELYVVD